MEIFFFVLAAVGMAVLLTVIFAAPYRGGGGWTGLWAFFVVILLFGLAGGLWTSPYGPAYGGIPWFGILFWSLLAALLLAAFPAWPTARRKRNPPSAQEREAEVALGGTFWLLLVVLLLAVAWGAIR